VQAAQTEKKKSDADGGYSSMKSRWKAGTTTIAVAKRVLNQLPSDRPIQMSDLAERLHMGEGNVRRALADLVILGLVVQLPVPRPLKKSNATPLTKFCRFGWKKVELPGSEKINTKEGIEC
jgi:DNA-binding MarR family transcriptional regulator